MYVNDERRILNTLVLGENNILYLDEVNSYYMRQMILSLDPECGEVIQGARQLDPQPHCRRGAFQLRFQHCECDVLHIWYWASLLV